MIRVASSPSISGILISIRIRSGWDCSSFAFDDDRVKALEAGCNDYLTKPLSAPLLKETIAKYLV